MEPLRLKPRQPVQEDIEDWDDDDFLMDGEELTLRSNSNNGLARRRDSGSSHRSLRSDLESWNGEEEKHVFLPGDDEKSTMDAISAAQNAGIPLPKNIQPSALTGGTIRRLGARQIRKVVHEDWDNDLEMPDMSQGLKIKTQDQTTFPETLRQVSGGSVQTSPLRTKPSPLSPRSPRSPQVPRVRDQRRVSFQSKAATSTNILSAAINLEKFKDNDDDDDFFGEGAETIKISKSRQGTKSIQPFMASPTPHVQPKIEDPEDDLEKDLELPSHGKLQLSTRRDIPKTPSSQIDDLDWGEGSLGTRYGGTRRDMRSNRSSSASAMSPSISSSITAESEDETFDGLLLPPGPFNFKERLQKRKKSCSPERIPEEPAPSPKKVSPAEADRPDFLDGLDIGDGDVFDSSKLTLHRNIRLKETRPCSPARPKTAVSLVFSNKPGASTRIPRLSSHERSQSTPLEPVSESGGPIPQRSRRPQSRKGHSSQSSVSSIPTPTTPSPTQQTHSVTPRRRELGAKPPTSAHRNEPTTTSAQLLKQKRSLPAIRALNPPARPLSFRYDRPPSRDNNGRPLSGIRPKTPVERRPGSSESPPQSRRGHIPFLPAGASQSQSQHVASKSMRTFRRHDSENAIDLRPFSRTLASRQSVRSPSPQRYRVAADTWERLSKPKNKKNFGDGHELDGFDDLPTSREVETRFMKQPLPSSAKTARNKVYQNIAPDQMTASGAFSQQPPAKVPQTPRFARDTAASRIARETSRAHRATASVPSASTLAQRPTPLSTRHQASSQPLLPPATVRSSRRTKRPPQLKPHLISNLNSGKESKMVNGMYYNADTYRWEGNENALNAFDTNITTPTSQAVPLHKIEKEMSTPRPALIANVGATKGVQVVGGMVFDPQNMCWLKIDQAPNTRSETSDSMDQFNAFDDEDVFKDIPDLDDNAGDSDSGKGRASDIKDDWLVGEEFDVGPEFIRRQREEEERWRKKCEKWTGRGLRDQETWRWTIRELVSFNLDDVSN